MNERKSKPNKKDEKDYYFPVILSQIICAVLAVAAFFFVRSTPSCEQLSRLYRDLLREDFLSAELDGAACALKEYFSEDGAAFAVFGSRVEPYEKAAEDVSGATSQAEPSQEQETEKETTTALLAEARNADTSVNTVPLKLSYKKQQEMIFPLCEGRYTSFFGERTDPIAEGSDYHKGIDIGADEGDIIMAAYDGTVASVGQDSRSGKYVLLKHEKDVKTFYCHCSEVLVKKGDKISQGDTIALVGSTGYSTGPHLHFEVRIKDISVDPLPLLEDAAEAS